MLGGFSCLFHFQHRRERALAPALRSLVRGFPPNLNVYLISRVWSLAFCIGRKACVLDAYPFLPSLLTTLFRSSSSKYPHEDDTYPHGGTAKFLGIASRPSVRVYVSRGLGPGLSLKLFVAILAVIKALPRHTGTGGKHAMGRLRAGLYLLLFLDCMATANCICVYILWL